MAKPPNIVLLITDQQRTPQHWPEDPGFVRDLMPADAELARTGLSFTNASPASCMCTPSRASLLTGRWPTEHGSTLTLTRGGARQNPRNLPHSLRDAYAIGRAGEVPPLELARVFARGAVRRPDGGLDERYLDPEIPNLASVLARAGYTTHMKGKWHLTNPIFDEWSDSDSELLEKEYGIHGWEPPDAGENVEPTHFGGGAFAGRSGMGYDEDFTRQVEAFLADPPPEPWALIVSLVNPHDVLGYPGSYEAGGYRDSEWADLDEIGLPRSVHEDMSDKPMPHRLMRLGQTGFLGPLEGDEAKKEYCRFYAHLHRVVDEKIGRVLKAMGDPDDPASTRSNTVVVRTSDHGEMAMSHGGMRQKMFNAYDETIRVPLVVSCPSLFGEAKETDAPASLCDVLPTVAALAGADVSEDRIRGVDLSPVIAREAAPDRERLSATEADFTPVTEHASPLASVQDSIHFTYDDHQAGSAFVDLAPPPNRVRAVRTRDATFAAYLDPHGRAPAQFELYDMRRDPDQVENLLDVWTGEVKRPQDARLAREMRELLVESMIERRTLLPLG